MFVQESPIVAPLMFVVSAAYGVTPSGRRVSYNSANTIRMVPVQCDGAYVA